MAKIQPYPNMIALVTGASSGIGEALCRNLISRGWTVIGIARSEDRLNALQRELGEACFLPQVCDVGDERAVATVSADLLERGLCPSLFFLNAGLAGRDAMETRQYCDLNKYKQTMAVNYFGVLAWIGAWEKACLANGGANFVVTSSMLAFYAPPACTAYAGTKAAIGRAFQGLALNYHGTPLRFSVMYPGPVATAGLKGKWPFTWTPERTAEYMVQRALKQKLYGAPFSWFYSVLLAVAPYLPSGIILKLLGAKREISRAL